MYESYKQSIHTGQWMKVYKTLCQHLTKWKFLFCISYNNPSYLKKKVLRNSNLAHMDEERDMIKISRHEQTANTLRREIILIIISSMYTGSKRLS